MTQEESKEYQYELQVVKELFFDENSQWGAYSFKIANNSEHSQAMKEIVVNELYQTFVISGKTERLMEQEKYKIVFTDSYSERYGKGYAFVRVVPDDMESLSSQKHFIKFTLTEKQADGIIRKFGQEPDLIDGIISGKHDITYVNGIGESVREGIVEKMKEYKGLGELVHLFSDLDISRTSILAIQQHFQNTAQVKYILENDFYRLTEVKGFGFKTVDAYALEKGIPKNSPSRLVKGAIYYFEEKGKNGDIKIDINTFDKEFCDLLDITEIDDETFNIIINSPDVTYINGSLALTDYVEEEKFIAQKLKELLQNVETSNIDEKRVNELIAEEEELNGFQFTDKQKEAIKTIIYQGVTIITGSAGTGKSKTVTTAVNILSTLGYSYIALALSGKAANVLQQNGLSNAGTLHRMLKWNPQVTWNIRQTSEMGESFDGLEDEIISQQVIVVDEASMLNNSIFARLLHQVKSGSRVVIVGDKGQLPPIGHGNVFTQLLESDLPAIKLDKIHRQAAKSGIISCANKVDKGKSFIPKGESGTHVLGELKDFYLFGFMDKTRILNSLQRAIEKFANNPDENNDDLQVITPMKKGTLGTVNLNQMIQSVFNPIRFGEVNHPIGNKMYLQKGDRVIQNGNKYDIPKLLCFDAYVEDSLDFDHNHEPTNVYNGTIGTIVDMRKLGNGVGHVQAIVKYENFDGVEYVVYNTLTNGMGESSISSLGLGYAITVHRSQGSGFHTVFFAFDYASYMLLSKELIYTGMTRTIKRLFMFAELNALEYGIRTTKSRNRKVFLGGFLK